jgi:hypothetical protein
VFTQVAPELNLQFNHFLIQDDEPFPTRTGWRVRTGAPGACCAAAGSGAVE